MQGHEAPPRQPERARDSGRRRGRGDAWRRGLEVHLVDVRPQRCAGPRGRPSELVPRHSLRPLLRPLEAPPGQLSPAHQHNIMSFCIRKKKPTFLMKLVTFNFLKELVNQHWYVQQIPIAYQITEVVRWHVDGWKKYIQDAAGYRRFSELRGQRAIRRHHQLQWSLKKPFDESVLIWHIATDLCFYYPNTSCQGSQGEAKKRSREISNYMIYLLLIRPEMLMPGTRSDLFTLSSDQIVKNSKGSLDMTEEILAGEIINMPPSSDDDVISHASSLAQELMELRNKRKMWTLIQGVWVEMLCYSASRCRGYLHAKSLGEGGECLSYIWLLWAYMGMETLADRHQRLEPPQEEGEEEKEEEEEEATSTSRSQGRADRSEDNTSPV